MNEFIHTPTPRQIQILELIARGNGNREVALELGISLQTVRNNLSDVFTKLQVSNRTGAVVAAHRRGYINLRAVQSY